MRWVAPSEKDTANEVLENRMWAAADQFRANSGLKAGQYSTPVLGLIFWHQVTKVTHYYLSVDAMTTTMRVADERAGYLKEPE